MEERTKMRGSRSALVGAVVMVAALIGVFVVVVPTMAQGPGYNPDDLCISGYMASPWNCTAKDFGIKKLELVTIHETCRGGTPGEFEADLQATISAEGANRYDIAYFINRDGTNAITGELCLHGYLFPPLTDTPAYTPNPTPTIFFGPWWTGPAEPITDTCGDMERGTDAVVAMTNVRFPCVDNDGNGFVDIDTCSSYRNNQQHLCEGLTDAFPQTASKCRCSIFNFPFQPTAIELISFGAAPQGDGVLLTWETATELDNIGFNVYRADSRDGQRNKLNDRLLPSQVTGSTEGATYTYLDETPVAGRTYFYWLEDVDRFGATSWHGPAEVQTQAAEPPSVPGQQQPPPVVPEASTLLLLGSAATGLASYVGLQIRARRRK